MLVTSFKVMKWLSTNSASQEEENTKQKTFFLAIHKPPTFKIAFYAKKGTIFVAIKKCAMIQIPCGISVLSGLMESVA